MCCLSRTIETEADTSKLCASQWSIEGGKRLGEIAGIGQEMIGAAVARDDLQRITELRMQRWFAASDGENSAWVAAAASSPVPAPSTSRRV